MFDYIIAENDFTAEIFTKQLDSQNFNQAIILKMGMPRNDIIIKSPIEIVNNIRCGLRLNSNTKIVLYAPTFRGAKTNDCFLLDFEMLKTELEFKYGGDWLVAFRYHPMQKDRFYLPNCIDFSDYQDMQELLLICDLLITDYSSSMWDFSLSGKPCFIFASDISNYINNERGDFLYPIEKLPFPLAQNNEELMSNIINFNVEYYKESLGKFYNEWGRYNIEGNATKQFVEFITLLP
jgi:CDP-glycerol glycerophosphotransferase